MKNGGIIIKEGNPGRGAAGCYIAKQDTASLKTPVIILRKGWDEETLVHEFTHHLRHADATRDGLTRTPFRMNDRGERIDPIVYRADEFNSLRNLEEASTVAESLVRIQKPSVGANGYYARTYVNGDTPYERYLYDRKVMAGEPGNEKPLKGRKAEKKVKSGFGDTSISHLGYYRPGSNAGKCYTDLKAEDKLPKAVKPKKKTKNAATAPTGSGRVPVEAMKSRNRMFYKPRK